MSVYFFQTRQALSQSAQPNKGLSAAPPPISSSYGINKKPLPMGRAILGLPALSVVFTVQFALRNGRHPVNSSSNFRENPKIP
jgi:hypothetical protein